MHKNEIIIIGGGAFAAEIIEVATLNKIPIRGICAPTNEKVQDYPILLNNESSLDTFFQDSKPSKCFIGIGGFSRRDIKKRNKIIKILDDYEISLTKLISPFSRISSNASIESGVYIAHNTVISLGAKISKNAIINTTAIVGHDSFVGKNSTISAMSFIGGGVEIGDNVIIGTGCKILPGVKIGDNSTIGIGSIVTSDIDSNSIVYPSLS